MLLFISLLPMFPKLNYFLFFKSSLDFRGERGVVSEWSVPISLFFVNSLCFLDVCFFSQRPDYLYWFPISYILMCVIFILLYHNFVDTLRFALNSVCSLSLTWHIHIFTEQIFLCWLCWFFIAIYCNILHYQ